MRGVGVSAGACKKSVENIFFSVCRAIPRKLLSWWHVLGEGREEVENCVEKHITVKKDLVRRIERYRRSFTGSEMKSRDLCRKPRVPVFM